MVVPVIAGSVARAAAKKVLQNGEQVVAKKVGEVAGAVANNIPIKRKPEDGSSFFASQNPVSNGVQPQPANDNNSKRKPSDEGGFVPRPANSNVPSTQRGGQPVKPNPTAVSPETQTTLPPNVAKILNTQGQRQINNNDNNDFDQSDFNTNNPQTVQDFNQPDIIEPTINETGVEVDSEAQSQSVQIPRVVFPFIIFIICIFEWFGVLILSLLGIIFNIILLPVGIAIGIALEAWKISFGIIIYAWILWYEGKYIKSLGNNVKNSMNLLNALKKKRLARKLFLGAGAIPLIGGLLPLNVYTVYSTYREVKKELMKLNS